MTSQVTARQDEVGVIRLAVSFTVIWAAPAGASPLIAKRSTVRPPDTGPPVYIGMAQYGVVAGGWVAASPAEMTERAE